MTVAIPSALLISSLTFAAGARKTIVIRTLYTSDGVVRPQRPQASLGVGALLHRERVRRLSPIARFNGEVRRGRSFERTVNPFRVLQHAAELARLRFVEVTVLRA